MTSFKKPYLDSDVCAKNVLVSLFIIRLQHYAVILWSSLSKEHGKCCCEPLTIR